MTCHDYREAYLQPHVQPHPHTHVHAHAHPHSHAHAHAHAPHNHTSHTTHTTHTAHTAHTAHATRSVHSAHSAHSSHTHTHTHPLSHSHPHTHSHTLPHTHHTHAHLQHDPVGSATTSASSSVSSAVTTPAGTAITAPEGVPPRLQKPMYMQPYPLSKAGRSAYSLHNNVYPSQQLPYGRPAPRAYPQDTKEAAAVAAAAVAAAAARRASVCRSDVSTAPPPPPPPPPQAHSHSLASLPPSHTHNAQHVQVAPHAASHTHAPPHAHAPPPLALPPQTRLPQSGQAVAVAAQSYDHPLLPAALPRSPYAMVRDVFIGTMSRDVFIRVCTSYLNGKMVENEGHASLPTHSEPESVFFSVSKPEISTEEYVRRLVNYTQCSPAAFIVMLVYLDRIAGVNGRLRITAFNLHRLLVTTLMLACKTLDDQSYSTLHYAKVGGIPTAREMNRLELQYLRYVDFRMHVPVELFFTKQHDINSIAVAL